MTPVWRWCWRTGDTHSWVWSGRTAPGHCGQRSWGGRRSPAWSPGACRCAGHSSGVSPPRPRDTWVHPPPGQHTELKINPQASQCPVAYQAALVCRLLCAMTGAAACWTRGSAWDTRAQQAFNTKSEADHLGERAHFPYETVKNSLGDPKTQSEGTKGWGEVWKLVSLERTPVKRESRHTPGCLSHYEPWEEVWWGVLKSLLCLPCRAAGVWDRGLTQARAISGQGLLAGWLIHRGVRRVVTALGPLHSQCWPGQWTLVSCGHTSRFPGLLYSYVHGPKCLLPWAEPKYSTWASLAHIWGGVCITASPHDFMKRKFW